MEGRRRELLGTALTKMLWRSANMAFGTWLEHVE